MAIDVQARRILQTLANLHTADNDGQKLRHQPLVLLHAIERVRGGGPRWVPYARIRDDLPNLLGELADGAARPDRSIPIIVLTRPHGDVAKPPAPIWEIEHLESHPRRSK